jgi:uncharacterized protein YccT (UPF0319 family)
MSLAKSFNELIGNWLSGVNEMQKNREIENNSNKIERNTESNEVSNNLRAETLNGKNNSQAFAAMDAGKSNSEADKMLQSTQLTIVDHDALHKSVDEDGYINGSVQNSVRAQVGHEAAEAAFAQARMTHASTVTEREPNNGNNNDVRASNYEVKASRGR